MRRKLQKRDLGTVRHRLRIKPLPVLLLLASLLITACGQETSTPANTPTPVPTATPTPVPTNTPIPRPTRNPGIYAGTIPLLSNPKFVSQEVSFTKNMGPDGYNWAQAFPLQVDKYNKIFSIAENNQSDHKFVFSNNSGLSWSESSEVERFLVRGSAAYDSTNDRIHVLWVGVRPEDGIIYRRYVINRDSSNNIVDISKEPNLTLQLDYQISGKMEYNHPVMLWLNDKEFGPNGALLAVWSSHDSTEPGSNEIRASLRTLENSATDGVASNWKVPVTKPDKPASNSPQVPYSAIFSSTTGVPAHVSVMRKTTASHAKDLYFFYSNGTESWEWRRASWNSTSSDWNNPLTLSAVIAKQTRAGMDKGYNLKFQLGTKPVEDVANDRVYFGFSTWKDDTAGDSWNYAFIDKNDTSSPVVDVYSANGIHSYAPTGDIVFDENSGLLIVAYLKTNGGGTYLQAYNGLKPVGSEILLSNSVEVDIPLLWQGGRYGTNAPKKLLVLFRNTVAPYQGYFGTLDWASVWGKDD